MLYYILIIYYLFNFIVSLIIPRKVFVMTKNTRKILQKLKLWQQCKILGNKSEIYSQLKICF